MKNSILVRLGTGTQLAEVFYHINHRLLGPPRHMTTLIITGLLEPEPEIPRVSP